NVDDDSILVFGPDARNLRYGDKVHITSTLEKPEPFETQYGKQFAYDDYLANQNIYLIARATSVRVTGYDPPSKLLALLYRWKLFFTNILATCMSGEAK